MSNASWVTRKLTSGLRTSSVGSDLDRNTMNGYQLQCLKKTKRWTVGSISEEIHIFLPSPPDSSFFTKGFFNAPGQFYLLR